MLRGSSEVPARVWGPTVSAVGSLAEGYAPVPVTTTLRPSALGFHGLPTQPLIHS